MSAAPSNKYQQRVLVLAPTARDASFCSTILSEAQLDHHLCVNLAEVCDCIEQGASAALLPEESLASHELGKLVDVVGRQPPWSDLPILVLMREGAVTELALSVLETLGNVTLLERPVRVPTLVSAIRTALRARQRQYQIRDLLLKADETAETLRAEAKRKDEFLAMLAHELRNPLAPIRNGVTILKLDSLAHEWPLEVLDMMERQVGHMVRLVDDLLDVSRILRGKISLRPEILDLSTIIQQAAETVRPLIASQQHTLTLSFDAQPLYVKADAVRLTQVFANLLNNAAKYTDAGGAIVVQVERMADNRLLARIRDNGMGIAPDMLPRVFDLFSQAERSLDRSQGGLGLGLTLVRRLVEMHGGTVAVFSRGLGKGSEFRVELPLTQQVKGEARPPPDPGVPSQWSAQRRILVVDDNRDAADSLSRLLRLAGHEVLTRYDGITALEELSRFRPDAVLLDVGLPGMSGYDVARIIRNSYQNLLLVAVTGYGQEEDRRSAGLAGFDYHFVKPVDIDSLQRVLGSAKSENQPLAS